MKQIPITILKPLLEKWKEREDRLYEKHKLIKSEYVAGGFDATHSCVLELNDILTK